MASNNSLITTATVVVVEANGTSDFITGSSNATAFVISAGHVGDDTLADFGKNDSLINYRSLMSEVVQFGENGTLLVDDPATANADRLSLLSGSETALRYLGNKDGGFAYASASVRLSGFTEGYVSNDTFDSSVGATTFFYDNALGLNLGFDTITNFGKDDRLVTTRRIYDSDGDTVVDFGSNGVLDLSGEAGPMQSDGKLNPGGQIALFGPDGAIDSVKFLFESENDGVMYYYYAV